jgi:hypothetical protein
MKLNFGIVSGSFTIHRLAPDGEIPENIFQCAFYSISRTDQELSIVCPSSLAVKAENSEAGWSCLKVHGPLDFSLTGILADISGFLARAGIGIFVISTFDTDYILVKSEHLEEAKKALLRADHRFID